MAVKVNYSPDSIIYVDIAQSIASGKGYSSYYLHPDTTLVPEKRLTWPPLYPILLALGLKMGLNNHWSAYIILFISFVFSSVIIYHLGRQLFNETFGLICLILWLSISTNLSIWTYAWSEPPFIVLVSLSIIVFATALKTRISYPMLFLSGLLAGLATECRYIGSTFAFSAPVCLFFYIYYQEKMEKKVFNLFLSSSCFLFGFALVSLPCFIHNLKYTGKVTGILWIEVTRWPLENLFQLLTTLGRDLSIPLFVGFTFLALAVWRSNWQSLSWKSIWNNQNKILAITCGVWILFYSVLLIILTTIYPLTPISTRYSSPIYLLLIPLIVYVGYAFFVQKNGEVKLSNPILAIIFLILLGSSFFNSPHRKDLPNLIKDTEFAYASVVDWIDEKTTQNTLFIGTNIWWIRFETDRIVMEVGYPEKPLETHQQVTGFLAKFNQQFDGIYLVFSRPILNEHNSVLAKYRRSGYSVKSKYLDDFFVIYEIHGGSA